MTANHSRRLALALLAAVLTLAPAALCAQGPGSLDEAQEQMRAAIARSVKERADKAKAAAAVAAAAGSGAKLSCRDKTRTADGFSGTLNLATMELTTTRSNACKAVKETDESRVVDGRCGSLKSPLAQSLTFEVTAPGYWGQDFLQLPKSAAAADGKPFEAQLHACSYDGDWHQDSDSVLVCTLSR